MRCLEDKPAVNRARGGDGGRDRESAILHHFGYSAAAVRGWQRRYSRPRRSDDAARGGGSRLGCTRGSGLWLALRDGTDERPGRPPLYSAAVRVLASSRRLLHRFATSLRATVY